MFKFVSPFAILLLCVEPIAAIEIPVNRCCTSKLEFATKLTSEIDKYEKQYNVARHVLTNLQQDTEIVSTMAEYLESAQCEQNGRSSCELKSFLKSFGDIRNRVSAAIVDLGVACSSLGDMAKALGNSSNCKYGNSLVGCANDRNVLECKLKKFVENALDKLYQSKVLTDIVERTFNILGEQANNFGTKIFSFNDSQVQCRTKNFFTEFVENIRTGRESLHQLDLNCNHAQSNINQFRAHIAIGSHCC